LTAALPATLRSLLRVSNSHARESGARHQGRCAALQRAARRDTVSLSNRRQTPYSRRQHGRGNALPFVVGRVEMGSQCKQVMVVRAAWAVAS
jgi:hypothetical protein